MRTEAAKSRRPGWRRCPTGVSHVLLLQEMAHPQAYSPRFLPLMAATGNIDNAVCRRDRGNRKFLAEIHARCEHSRRCYRNRVGAFTEAGLEIKRGDQRLEAHPSYTGGPVPTARFAYVAGLRTPAAIVLRHRRFSITQEIGICHHLGVYVKTRHRLG